MTFSVSRNEKFWRRKNVWEQSIKRLWHFLKVKFQFNQRRRWTAALENLKSEIIWELMADIYPNPAAKKLYKNMWNSLKTKGALAENGTKQTALWIWENSSIFREKKRNHTSTLTTWFLPWVPKKGSNFVWPHHKECYVGLSCHVNPNLSKKEKLPAGAKFRKKWRKRMCLTFWGI